MYTYGHTLSLHDALPIWPCRMGHIATPGRRCDGDGNQRWHCPFAAGPLLATGELGLPPPAFAMAGKGWTAWRGPWRTHGAYSAIWRRVASTGARRQYVAEIGSAHV